MTDARPGRSTAAMSTFPEISPGVAGRAIIAPPGGRAAISDARAATSAQASSSDRIPAQWAAAISPIEWRGHRVRRHAPRLQQPEQRHLDREDRGLGVAGVVEALTRGDDVVQRPVEVEPGADRVEGVGEDGIPRVEPGAHPGALGALAGEQEHGRRVGVHDALERGAAARRSRRARPAGRRGSSR